MSAVRVLHGTFKGGDTYRAEVSYRCGIGLDEVMGEHIYGMPTECLVRLWK